MESQLLTARINDTVDICYRTQSFKFLGFLRPEEALLAKSILTKRNARFELFGGYSEAERVVLGALPEWAENATFPITAITFKFRKNDSLSHRDFLGSFMALGLKRETIGDILIDEGRAVAFVLDDVSEYILKSIEKIGRVGVEASIGYELPLPLKSRLLEVSDTVASKRLDCIVSALTGLSRASATEKIELGLVSVNSQVTEKCTKSVNETDIISVRGYGKYTIVSLNDKTRKNRIILKYNKYV